MSSSVGMQSLAKSNESWNHFCVPGYDLSLSSTSSFFLFLPPQAVLLQHVSLTRQREKDTSSAARDINPSPCRLISTDHDIGCRPAHGSVLCRCLFIFTSIPSRRRAASSSHFAPADPDEILRVWTSWGERGDFRFQTPVTGFSTGPLVLRPPASDMSKINSSDPLSHRAFRCDFLSRLCPMQKLSVCFVLLLSFLVVLGSFSLSNFHPIGHPTRPSFYSFTFTACVGTFHPGRSNVDPVWRFGELDRLTNLKQPSEVTPKSGWTVRWGVCVLAH